MDSFLQQKFQWLFSFFDTDRSGMLEQKDFEQRAQRASTAVYEYFQQKENGAEILRKYFDSIRDAQSKSYNALFQHLIESVDLAGDNKISINEWLQFCSKVKQNIDNTGKLPKWFEDLLVYYFNNVLDFNRNGKIDFYEMTFMGDAPPEVTWYCFDKITNGNQLELDVQLFLQMTTLYMSSSDQNCKSRYMFGFIERQE